MAALAHHVKSKEGEDPQMDAKRAEILK